MPLLRYKTNDKAIPLDDVERQSLCKCGRSLSIPFRGIEGRSDDIIYKEGKHPIPTINIYNLMEKFQEVKQFYILQESDLSVKMIVTESKPISSESLSRLKTGIRQRIGNLPLEVDVVKEIKLLGKDNICEIHMKENGYLLGEGTMDWNGIAHTLEEIGYHGDGWMQIEWAKPKDMDLLKAYQHNLGFLRNNFK
mgnify:CR=1 FL=1